MTRPSLVGRKIVTGNALTTSGATISLTDLTGGLASQPSEGDKIYVGFGAASTSNLSLAITDASDVAYDAIGSEDYANDSHDTNFLVAEKLVGATADTSFKIDTDSTTRAYVVLVEVWRDAFQGPSPSASATGTNDGRPNPPSITPDTTDSNILIFGVGATSDSAGAAFTSSDLTDFQSSNSDGSSFQSDMAGGMGYKEWTSGAFDAAQFGGGSSSSQNSWASRAIVIKPYDPDYVPPVEFVSEFSVDGSGVNIFVDPANLSPAYAEDDVFIIAVVDEGDPPDVPATPSGWTALGSGVRYTFNSPANMSWGVFAKKASASEGSITLYNANGWDAAAASLMCFRNAGQIADILSSFSGGNSAPSLAGALASDIALQGILATNESSFVPQRPSGWSDTALNANSDGSGSNAELGIFHDEITADGTVSGNVLATYSATTGYQSFTIIIPADRVTAQDLTPSLVTNTQAFYGPTVTSIYAIAPGLFTNDQTFHAPTITTTVDLSPGLLTNTQTFFSPTVTQGLTLEPSLFTNDQAFFAPSVSVGPVTLEPGLLTNSQTFHAPTVTSNYVLQPSLVENDQTFFSPTISLTYTIAPPLLTNEQTFFSPAITTGEVTLAPSLLTNAQTFFAPTISIINDLRPPLLTNSQTFFAPTVVLGEAPFQSGAGLEAKQYDTLLVEIAPLDPADGTRKTIRATNVNDHRVTGLNDLIWRPAISENAKLAIRLFKGDFDGIAAPAGGNLSLQVDQLEQLQANVRRFVWAGSTIKIWSGRAGQAWPWDQVFEGLIGDNPRAERNRITLPIEVNAEPFEADILTEIYAGTGDAEGGADLKDKPKPWLLGRCFNVEPLLINATDSVFQFSAYGTIEAVTKLYERGSDFGASFGDYADYAALVAASIPAGRWGTCLAEGLVRLGAPPVGVITGDVDGDKYDGTWRRKTGEIILRVATNAGAGSLVDTTSLSDLDTAVAAVATTNQGRIGVYLTEQETLIDFASRLAAPCNAQAGISLLGELFVSRPGIGTATATLDAQQRQMPRVTKSIELGTKPPFSKVEMGYARSWKVHSNDEIAYYADLVERGRYDASTFYREGNIVDLEDGSRWVYINAVPGSGNAPPDWPTTSNAYWDNLSPPLRFQVDVYLSPDRVPVPANTSGTVTSYATASFDFIAKTTEGVDVSTAFLLTLATGGNPDGLTYSIDNGSDPPSVTISGGLTAAESPGQLTIDATGSGDYDGMVFQRTFTIDVDQTGVMLQQILTLNDNNSLTPPSSGQSISGLTLETLHPDGTVTYKVTFNWDYDSNPADDNNFDAIIWMLAVNTTSAAVTLGGPDAPTANERGGVLWIDVTDLSTTMRIISQGDPTKWYTLGFAKWRKVAPGTNAKGYIMGPITQYGPFQPSTTQNFTGNVNGQTAANVAQGTIAANAALTPVTGLVKTGKVDTSSIIASSVTNSSEGKYTGFGTLSAPDTTNLYCIFEQNFTTHGLPVHVFAEAINEMYTTTDATAGDIFTTKFILTRSLASNPIVSMQDGGSLTTYANHIAGGAVALTPNVAIRQYQHYGADATIYQAPMLAKIGAVDLTPPGTVSSPASCVYGLWFGKTASAHGAYVAGIRDRIAMALLETMR